jgi:hypothetical protein
MLRLNQEYDRLDESIIEEIPQTTAYTKQGSNHEEGIS